MDVADQIRTIVAATDFTPCSAVALGQAFRVGAWAKASVHIVHVIDTVVVVEMEEALQPMQQDIRRSLTEDATRTWEEFRASIPGAGERPLEVVINNRVKGIIERAGQDAADLLVLGAFGTRRPDVGVGSVASGCVRKAPCDVLLVRDTQPGPFKRILVGTDFSPCSAQAIAKAAMVAECDGAELIVLHVYKGPWHELHYKWQAPMTQPHMQDQYRSALEGRLQQFSREAIGDRPKLAVQCQMLDDHAGHRSVIAEHAKATKSDLIVLGTRGRSNLRDMFLGSTAERTLELSPCSVWAVRPR